MMVRQAQNAVARITHHVRTEYDKIGRFLIIGGVSFLIYAATYALLSRWAWVTGDRTAESFISTVVSAVFNYFAHRSWTFRAQGSHRKQFFRYLVTIVSASLIQTGLFWFGHAVLHIYDFLLIVVISGAMPCYTYVMHRLFTFGPGTAAPPGAAGMV